MPWITLKIGIAEPDGREAVLKEYLCDWPDCPDVAEETLGVVRELGIVSAMCRHHVAQLKRKGGNGA
jgi:hypothetical protein